LCRECARESIHNVIRLRTCQRCGTDFDGYPGSKFCPECAVIQKKERAKEYRERKKKGTVRKLGSTASCEKCGKEYTVTGGLQKYCPDCAEEAIRENDRAKSREWNAANIDYDQRREDRQRSTAYIKCLICGKEFQPNEGSPVTCSSECAKKLSAQNHAEWEKKNKEQRLEYQRNLYRKKIDAMTAEELAEYRKKTNERARENYKKRKDKEKENPNA
jgi:uncharacterized Zn ribbon protein